MMPDEKKPSLFDVSYDEAYGDDSILSIDELKIRVRLIHSWVKLHQRTINRINKEKNDYQDRIKELEKELKILQDK